MSLGEGEEEEEEGEQCGCLGGGTVGPRVGVGRPPGQHLRTPKHHFGDTQDLAALFTSLDVCNL